MAGQRAQHTISGHRSTVKARRHRRRAVAVALLTVVSAVTMSCAGSPRTSSTVAPSTSTTSTTVMSSPVCDALLGAVGTMLTGDGATGWSSMVAGLRAVTPQLPENLRGDWTIVLARLEAMATGPGAAPPDLNDPASMQRYAEELLSADQPELARALGAIQSFVEDRCPT